MLNHPSLYRLQHKLILVKGGLWALLVLLFIAQLCLNLLAH